MFIALALALLPAFDAPPPTDAATVRAVWLANIDPATGQARKRKAKGLS